MAKPKLVLELEGVEDVIEKFEEIVEKKSKETKDHIKTTAVNIQRGAKKRAPVDDGILRASIVLEPYRDGLSIDVGSRLPYAAYQEWGTGIHAQHPSIPGRKTPWSFKHPKTGDWWINFRGARPHPFLFPAFEEERPKFIKGLEKIYNDL